MFSPRYRLGEFQISSADFERVATQIKTSMARRLKVEGSLSVERAPMPNFESAQAYAARYFARAPEAAFGIVHEQWFRSRLQAHYSGAQDEMGWYALRNALLAHGCGIVVTKRSGFREAMRASWALFENAISCLPHLLLYSSSIRGLQAVTLMAYFSEGLSSPSLQYMLTSNAMRLACSMGLHRKCAPSWNMSKQEVRHRSRLFWAIYCLEKQTASRSGRPSMMDDGDISCCLPLDLPVYCYLLVDLCKISSRARRQLLTVEVPGRDHKCIYSTIAELSSKLDHFKSKTATTHGFDVSKTLDLSQLPRDLHTIQALSIYFQYHCLVLDVHTLALRPWMCARGQQTNLLAHAAQAAFRTAVAEACRKIILTSRFVQVDASYPSLVAGFGLMYASLCLFTHILQVIDNTTRRSDLLLLDIAVGCSHNLELETEGEWSLPFLKDLRGIARAAVEQSRDAHTEPADVTTVDGTKSHPDVRYYDPNLAASEVASFDIRMGDELEMWSTLLRLAESGDLDELPW